MRSFLIAAVFLCPSAARAADARSQAESSIRSTVASSLPPDLAQRASRGSLSAFLSGLPADRKEEALRLLASRQDSFDDDPAKSAALSEAYMSLGDSSRALSLAEAALLRDYSNPDALGVKARVLAGLGQTAEARAILARLPAGHPQRGLVDTAIRLSREPSAGPPPSPAAAAEPVRPGVLPAGVPPELGRKLERAFGLRGRSETLDGALRQARSLEDLARQGIHFRPAAADQAGAVRLAIDREAGTYTVFVRPDAMGSDARMAAHFANGLTQANLNRDDSTVAWLKSVVGGWLAGARTHKELAPSDAIDRPQNPSDNDIAIQRRLLDLPAAPYDKNVHVYAGKDGSYMGIVNILAKNPQSTEKARFATFINSTGRGKLP
ncbi:MAG: tetratricopeptide repeat protein [Elusimicrobia bacterium]|nr:tetratricopeptide repeat protein [Elusimicrobiota bacterium]